MDDDALIRYHESRDITLRNELCVRHLPLVKFVARKMSTNLPDNVERDDLISWGALGLLDAIEKFNPELGHAFSTYAVPRIRGEILDGLQKMEWAPKQVTGKVRLMRRVREKLTLELNRLPSPEEIAEAMGCDGNDVRAWLFDDQVMRTKSLDTRSVGSELGDYDVNESWATEDPEQDIAGEVSEIRSRVAKVIATLGKRERDVFILYYRDRMTLKEIAESMGCSVSSATQTHTRLVEQVRVRLATYGEVA